MLRKLTLQIALSFLAILAFNSIAQTMPTQAQIEQFKKLPPAQQKALAKSMGVDLSSLNLGGNSSSNVNVTQPTEQQYRNVDEATISQRLAQQSAAQQQSVKLRPFGYSLFQQGQTAFQPPTNIAVPADYILGPGDTIHVQLYGKATDSLDLQVNNEGSLDIPDIGPMNVAGMTYSDLKAELTKKYQQQFIGVTPHFSMGELRTIQVYMIGEAFRPGTYTVSALSTVTNALFIAGGVSDIGSLRNIEVKRSGKTIGHFDLYNLLVFGDTSGDVRLQQGDVIFIPPVTDVISLDGQVRRPAIYELKKGETLADALKFAGGALPSAAMSSIRIMSANGQQGRTMHTLSKGMTPAQKTLHNGDYVYLPKVNSEFNNAIMLIGAVENPGLVQWRPTTHLSDIISADKLLTTTDLHYGLIVRRGKLDRKTQVIQFVPQQVINGKFDVALKSYDQVMLFNQYGTNKSEQPKDNNQLTQAQASLFDLSSASTPNATNGEQAGVYPVYAGSDSSQYNNGQYNNSQYNNSQDNNDQYNNDQYNNSQNNNNRPAATSGNPNSSNAQDGSIPPHFLGPKPDFVDIDNIKKTEDPFNILDSNKAKTSGYTVSYLEKLDRAAFTDKQVILKDTQHYSRKQLLTPLIVRLQQEGDTHHSVQLAKITGQVRYPGVYPIPTQGTINDLVAAAGGLLESAYLKRAELTRTAIGSDEKMHLQHQSISLNGDGNESAANIVLQSKDNLNVLRVPDWIDNNQITLVGEVKFPGTYKIKKGETLEQVLQRAGGLTKNATVDAAIFTRLELKQRERQNTERVIQDLKRQLANNNFSTNNNVNHVNYDEASKILHDLENTNPLGRLVINLPAIIAGNHKADVELKGGDTLYVPNISNAVSVVGEVFVPTTHRFEAGLSVNDYIKRSGGLRKVADSDRIYVVHANGSVTVPGSHFWYSASNDLHLEPGDTIVVPRNIGYMDNLTLWQTATQIIYQSAISIVAISKI